MQPTKVDRKEFSIRDLKSMRPDPTSIRYVLPTNGIFPGMSLHLRPSAVLDDHSKFDSDLIFASKTGLRLTRPTFRMVVWFTVDSIRWSSVRQKIQIGV